MAAALILDELPSSDESEGYELGYESYDQGHSSGDGPDEATTLEAVDVCKSPLGLSRRTRTISQSSSKRYPILRSLTRTIYTAGRPPWYDPAGQLIEPCVIGISGGSASGKTTVADKIIKDLNVPWVTRLSMDCFYKVLSPQQHDQAAKNNYNFDHPDAFDFELLAETLQRLKEGKKVEVPVYNFVTHGRESNTKTMYGANVIIFEGILTFHNPKVTSLLDVKVFVDTDADTRLARRLKRDISERGRDLKGVLQQYNKFVKPSFDVYIAPQMAHADIIVPRGGDNEVAINLIVQHVLSQLQARGLKVREKLAEEWHNQGKGHSCSFHDCSRIFSTLYQLAQHTLSHTGEKPHKCPCGKEYRYKPSLTNHQVSCSSASKK